jgi:hypothetical protein
VNYKIYDIKVTADPGVLHRDTTRTDSLLINVWIALEDVDARPLAFMKMNGKPLPRSAIYPVYPHIDPESEYVIVSKMKKGEMLIFYGNRQSHGTPIILGNNGKRLSMGFFYQI